MRKLIIQFQAFGALLFVVLAVQAQDQPIERPDKSTDPASTNVLEGSPNSSESRSSKSRLRNHPSTDRVVIRENVVIEESDAIGDMVVVGGSAKIYGQIRSLVVIGGSVTLGTKAEVRSELVVIGGSVTLATNAEVQGDLIVVGGVLNAPTAARVDGERIVVSSENSVIPDLGWLSEPLDWRRIAMTARPFPRGFGRAGIMTAVLLLLFLIASVLFPRPLDKCVETLELRPGGSFVTGLLAFMLVVPFVLLLVCSFIGIVLVPIIILGLSVAFLFGKIAVYRHAGQHVGKQFSFEILRKPLVALLAGVALFYALYMVPILGLALWLAVAPLALGAVLLTFFRQLSAPKPPSPPVDGETRLPSPPPPLGQNVASAT